MSLSQADERPPVWIIPARLRNPDAPLYALAVSVGVLFSFYPFLVLTLSFFRDILHWPAATDAVYLAIENYFPGDMVNVIRRRLPLGGRVQLASLLFLVFAANAIFRPLRFALNRALGTGERRSPWMNQAVYLGLAAVCSGLTLVSLILTSVERAPGSPCSSGCLPWRYLSWACFWFIGFCRATAPCARRLSLRRRRASLWNCSGMQFSSPRLTSGSCSTAPSARFTT
jgi:uncharacterized BrkB/YihY/UPF0761 family membrane protein